MTTHDYAYAAVAPGVALLLSLTYIIGWLSISGLEVLTTLRRAGRPVATLVGLDTARASILTVSVLIGFVNKHEPISTSTWVALLFWSGVGVSSFFVSFKLPPSTRINGQDDSHYEDTSEPGEEEQVAPLSLAQLPVPDDMSELGSLPAGPELPRPLRGPVPHLLYKPNTGLVKIWRSKAASELVYQARAELIIESGVRFSEANAKRRAAFHGGADKEDVRRALYQVDRFIEIPPAAMSADKRTTLQAYILRQRQEIDDPRNAVRGSEYYDKIIEGLLNALSTAQIPELRMLLIETKIRIAARDVPAQRSPDTDTDFELQS